MDPTVSELALLGHNLRTPLTIINGYAELLIGDDLTAEARAEACRQILEKCSELNALIRELVDAGQLELMAGARRSA
ncbi:MAG TPA: histidine kinase dimerization/phospho-acceptor domain-containing protein [Candidatus Dormibacteraeota bacterium]|nr:histidine kinase dimerization/phospho-acceptor domain-containing protein [Candidatus Dormibacteraeota bacterium]